MFNHPLNLRGFLKRPIHKKVILKVYPINYDYPLLVLRWPALLPPHRKTLKIFSYSPNPTFLFVGFVMAFFL